MLMTQSSSRSICNGVNTSVPLALIWEDEQMLCYLASEHQVKCLSVQCCNSLNAGKALNVLDNEEST